ncbi:MAG: hypothetical protein ACJAZK_001456 [Psychroserpens sp.]|jgi:hypothetical protein|uniref:T9SS type A sorting domain-containing protein n=1 Tax=Psychroserpens sp. TaxID=2020870 RepID=UPI0039E671D9
MTTKLQFTIIALLCVFISFANNDKYRLIIVDDPATKITIGWNQISGNNPIVYYDSVDHGTDISLYTFSKIEDRSINYRNMDNRFARLTGLQPNTNYYFVIADDEGISQRFWFKTTPDDTSRLSFVAGGDSRNNRSPRQNANKLVSKLKPHAVFFGGDMTDDDTNTEWRDWFDDWQLTTSSDGRMIPIVPTRGNHENNVVVYNLFDTPDENSYYAVTFGDNLIRTYTLNSEISVLGDQLTWLQDDLTASSNMTWKMAQYHKPMRPHTASKSEGNAQYGAWAQLFYDEQVKLVVDCDSHMSKTTWPVRPSSGVGNDEGFEIDQQNGTVYTGEGCWGAPLRSNNDDKSWTRNSGTFNQFKLIFVDAQTIKLRTILVNNADDVAEVDNDDPFTLPENLDVFSPETGAVVTISNEIDNDCPIVGTPCDDTNAATLIDEENGFCSCEGLPENELIEETLLVAISSDDAEESVSTGNVDVTGSNLDLIQNDTEQLVGIRFDNVQIPSGATLYRAYIQFESASPDDNQETNLNIHGELAISSATFSSATNDISSRILTMNSVNWSEVDSWESAGETDLIQRTPYLNTVISEIIMQDDWISGNALSFIISGEGQRMAKSQDSGNAPILRLFYQLPCNDAGTACDDGDANTIIDVEDGNCNCIGILETDTVITEVDSGPDDAEQSEIGGIMYIDSSDLELVFDSFAGQNNQTVGVRFNNILVPSGAIISEAYIQFTTDESNDTPTNISISGELSANSITFTETNFDIENRTRTNAVVNWPNIPEWSVVGSNSEAQKTPNVQTIVQEIVEQDSWSILNSMTFFFNGEGKRTAESYNGDASASPQLIISYTLNDNCTIAGTPCDDGDDMTVNDEQNGFCGCIGLSTLDLVEDDIPVANNSDDAEESIASGQIDINSSDLELIYDGVDQLVGIRFDNVQLPEEAILYRAYIQFQTDEDDFEEDPTNLIINGELAVSSETFSEATGNISSRILTTSNTAWDEIALWDTVGETGLNQRTPYVTSIINEVTTQDGWVSGNPITFIISGNGKRVAEAKDGSAAPILKLFYQYATPCPDFGTACDDNNENTYLDVEDGNCNCAGVPESGTLTYSINASNNDAEEAINTGEMDLGSSDLELTFESGTTNQIVGLRFTGIQLPSDALIINAYIQFTVDDDNTDDTNLNIAVEASGNSTEFLDTDFNLSNRITAANSVVWSNIPEWTTVGEADVNQQTPNISVLITDVLTQTDWNAFNAMSFIFTGTGEREAESFDGSAAAQLVIEYELNTLSLETIKKDTFEMYPNPSTSILHLKSTNKIEQVSLYNIIGQKVLNLLTDSVSVDLDVSKFEAGVYFIEIRQNGNQVAAKKVIIN